MRLYYVRGTDVCSGAYAPGAGKPSFSKIIQTISGGRRALVRPVGHPCHRSAATRCLTYTRAGRMSQPGATRVASYRRGFVGARSPGSCGKVPRGRVGGCVRHVGRDARRCIPRRGRRRVRAVSDRIAGAFAVVAGRRCVCDGAASLHLEAGFDRFRRRLHRAFAAGMPTPKGAHGRNHRPVRLLF